MYSTHPQTLRARGHLVPWLLALGFLLWGSSASAQTYTGSFTSGQSTPAGSQVCLDWVSFQNSLSSNVIYESVVLKGSRDTEGFTCTGATANQICQQLRIGDGQLHTFTCDGATWNVGDCGSGTEVNAGVSNPGMCSCPGGDQGIVRPCIGNSNWGGFNGATCGGTTQTMQVLCNPAGANDPPAIQSIANQTHDEGATVSLQVQATDPQGDSLSYSANTLPTGLTLNPSTGLISGTIGASGNQNSPYSVTITVSDGLASSTVSFTWTVNDTLNVGASSYFGSFTSGQSTPPSSQVCQDWVAFQSGLDANHVYDQITLKGSRDTEGFTCTGATANQICQQIRIGDGQLHTFTCDGATWNVGNCGSGTEVNAGVSNPGMCSCPGGDQGIVRPCIGNNNWGGFNGATCGGTTQTMEVICGNSGPNDPPTIQSIANQTHDEGATVSLQVQATDPEGDSLTYSVNALPGGLSLNTSTGLISGEITGDASDNSPYSVTVTVTDTRGNTATVSFTWTINNTLSLVVHGYSENFTSGQSTPSNSEVCMDWVTFQQTLQSNVTYDRVTLKGSRDEEGFTCSGATANQICQQIRLGDGQTHTFTCDGITWNVGDCGDGTEVNAGATNPGMCSCPGGDQGIVRPCIGNSNWGGFNGATCGGGTQRMDVLCQFSGNNTAPSLAAVANQTHDEGDTVSLQLQGTDPDPNTTLVYSATGLPSDLTLNTATGLISGELGSSAAVDSPYTVTVSVSDGLETVERSFTWTINDTIVITSISYFGSFTSGQSTPSGSQVCQDWVAFQGNLQDNDVYDQVTIKGSRDAPGFTCNGATANEICQQINNHDGQRHTWNCDGNVWNVGTCGAGVEVNAGATNPGMCSCPNGDQGIVRPCIGNNNWGGFNGNTCSGGTQTMEVICGRAGINTAPSVTAVPNQSHDEGDAVSLQLQATDAENNPVTWSADALPGGLSLNPSTGLISGQLSSSAGDNSPYTVTVTASDGRDAGTATFTWTVNDTIQVQAVSYSENFTSGQSTPSTSEVCRDWGVFQGAIDSGVSYNSVTLRGSRDEPGFTCTGEVANQICQQIRADDRTRRTYNCDGHVWNVGSCGSGMEVNAGLTSAGMCSCPGGDQGIVRPCIGNSNWGGFNGATCGGASQRMDVICGEAGPNQPPVLQEVADQTHDEGASVSLQPMADDPNGQNLSWTVTGLPPGLSLDPSTGLISGTLTLSANNNSPYSVTLTVSDGVDTDSTSFTWTVNDVELTTVRVLSLSPNASDATQAKTHLDGLGLDLEIVSASSNSVTLAQLQQYNAVLIFTNSSPSNPGPLGDMLASYVDSGGGVVEAVFSQYASSYDVEGRWDSGNYTVVNRTSSAIYTSGTLGTLHQPGHPILNGVTSISVSNYRTGTTSLRANTTRLADYNDGQVLSAIREDKAGRVAWVGYFPREAPGGQGTRLLANSLFWVAGRVNGNGNNNGNNAPALGTVQAQNHAEGQAVSLQLPATDDDGDPLTWTVTGLPGGLSANTSTGLITGTVANGAANNSPYTVAVSVTDGSATATGSFTWTIYNNQPPTVAWTSPSEGWHSSPVTVSGTISQPGCDLAPTVQNINGLAMTVSGSNGSWTFQATNVGNGTYAPLNLSVTSGCNGALAQTSRSFGVDTSAPILALGALNQNGVDPMDSATWPAVGEYDQISLSSQVRDLESGVVSVTFTLTDLQEGSTVTLHSQSLPSAGTPPVGTRVALAPGCTNMEFCLGSALNTSALTGTQFRLTVTLANAAGNSVVSQRYFRTVGLIPAIMAWDQRAMETLSSDVPTAQAALDRAWSFFDVALASAQEGQWGSVALSLQVAEASLRAAKALDPSLDLDLSANERGLVARTFAGFLRAQAGQARENGADSNTMDTAEEFIFTAEQVGDAGTVLNLLANAWFWMQDALEPMVATNFAQTLSLLERIISEMDAYVTHDPALVGQAQIAEARTELGDVQLLVARVVENGDTSLSDLEHVRLLLGLTNTAEFLATAQNGGTWVRNWQWGLTQIVYIYAARGLNNAASILNFNNPVVDDGYSSLDSANAFRQDRKADDFMRLLIDSRCLVLSIYNFAYNPDEDPPQACCEEMLRFHELDNRFPVPQRCDNHAPVLGSLSDRSDNVEANISFQPTATDADGDDLTWSASGLPPGLTINPSTGLISGTITSGANSPYSVQLFVSDGFSQDSASFSWVVTSGDLPGYLGSFTSGQSTPQSSQVCQDWRSFRAGLSSGQAYTQVTLRGSRDPQGFTCSGATADQICQQLRIGDGQLHTFTCDGHVWNVGDCGDGTEINAGVTNPGMCSCPSDDQGIVRPCIGNANWGGFNGATCSGATQTMEVICQ